MRGIAGVRRDRRGAEGPVVDRRCGPERGVDAAACALGLRAGREESHWHAARTAVYWAHRRYRAHARVRGLDCRQARSKLMRAFVTFLLLIPVMPLAQPWPHKPL